MYLLIMSTTRSTTINVCHNGELLVGLNASNNGCSCEQHECCGGGKAVKADEDVIRFKLAVVVEDVLLGKPLATIKAVLIKDSMEHCTTVGFLGREEVAALPSQKSMYINKFVQVLELWYNDNEN
jgi:hypothetical protein